MQDRVSIIGVPLQFIDCLNRWKHDQFDMPPLRLLFHFFHHRQSAVGASADHQAVAVPGYLLLQRQWSMSKIVAEFFGCLLLAFADPSAVDQDIMLICDPINPDRAKGKFIKSHGRLLRHYTFDCEKSATPFYY